MRILVTGATGFIGQNVLKRIVGGENDIMAIALEKEPVENSDGQIKWFYDNIKNIVSLGPAIKSFNPEVVVHLAWQGIPDYSEDISRANLNDSIELLDFIIEETNCRKIIVSGSCFEYGKNKGVCRETDAVQLTSFISWAKYSLYQYLLLKCDQKKIELVWFRIFYTYGPYQREGALIPALAKVLKDGKKPEIRSPLNKNDFIYIEDVSEAFKAAIDMKSVVESGAYNLGCGVSRSVYDVCRIIEKHFPESPGISDYVLLHGSKDKALDFSADINKMVKIFKWRPKISLEEGVSKYIEFLNGKSEAL